MRDNGNCWEIMKLRNNYLPLSCYFKAKWTNEEARAFDWIQNLKNVASEGRKQLAYTYSFVHHDGIPIDDIESDPNADGTKRNYIVKPWGGGGCVGGWGRKKKKKIERFDNFPQTSHANQVNNNISGDKKSKNGESRRIDITRPEASITE
jgi:hypothetical protein